MVPQAALGSSQLGKYVYVVGKDNIVEQRLVSLGATDGDLVSDREGRRRGRPGHRRQSAEDRPRHAGSSLVAVKLGSMQSRGVRDAAKGAA